jgi:hypothetical protein
VAKKSANRRKRDRERVRPALACARVIALSRRPKGEIFRAVEPGRENDLRASRGKLQDITLFIPKGFRYEEITRRVKGQAMRIVKTGSERALHAGGSEHKNYIVWPVAQRRHKETAAGVKSQDGRILVDVKALGPAKTVRVPSGANL